MSQNITENSTILQKIKKYFKKYRRNYKILQNITKNHNLYKKLYKNYKTSTAVWFVGLCISFIVKIRLLVVDYFKHFIKSTNLLVFKPYFVIWNIGTLEWYRPHL